MSNSAGFGTVDVEDIKQDLVLDLLHRLPRFNPGRASFQTFVARVVRNCAATRRERALAAKRGARTVHRSLHDTVPSENGGEYLSLIDIIDGSASLWSEENITWDIRSDIHIDVLRAIAGLPRPLAELAGTLRGFCGRAAERRGDEGVFGAEYLGSAFCRRTSSVLSVALRRAINARLRDILRPPLEPPDDAGWDADRPGALEVGVAFDWLPTAAAAA